MLIALPQRLAEAMTRELARDGCSCRRAGQWLPADHNALLVVAATEAPTSTTVSIRRVSAAPLFLVTRAPATEMAAALQLGADVCLAPTEPLVLLAAQAAALLRRQRRPEVRQVELKVGGLLMDRASRRAQVADIELQLSPREFDLLAHMAGHPGRAFRRHELLDTVWDPTFMGAANTVDVHIAWLRHKLPEISGVRITTIRGVGYRLDVVASEGAQSVAGNSPQPKPGRRLPSAKA